MQESNQITPIANPPEVTVGLTTVQGFELAQRCAKVLAMSTLVPKQFQGNLSNCIIALNMAQRIGADPLMVMQNLYIVYERPSFSSQFLIATFNSCGRFSALRYEFFGEPGTDSWGCRAWAVEKGTNEKLTGADVTISLARREGWYDKKGSKWQTMPQQMLMYRAASWFIRAYAPEIAMGLQTTEEAKDMVIDVEPAETITMESLQRSLESYTPELPASVEVDAQTLEEEFTPLPNTPGYVPEEVA